MAVAHVVGGLSLDEGRLFRSHLLECTSCRARVGELRAIAHDLADVERDERRERAARRTETKAREDDEPELPEPAPRRLNGRATLAVAVGLVVLMALSSWNFLLRGRIAETDANLALLRQSTSVIRDGTRWVDDDSRDSPKVKGLVHSFNDELVVTADGLGDGTYTIYLLDAAEQPIHAGEVTATNGVIYDFLDSADVRAARELVLVNGDRSQSSPTSDRVFAARRSAAGAASPQTVGEPSR